MRFLFPPRGLVNGESDITEVCEVSNLRCICLSEAFNKL